MEAETPSTRFGRIRQGPRRTVGAVARVLAAGIPIRLVAALAALVLVAILFTVATREPEKIRGYSELTLFPKGCLVDATRERNALGCRRVGPRAYQVAFTKSLDGSTPIASRGSCCPGGSIGASAQGPRTVVLALNKRVKRPIRVSLIIP
jgi:hypothetical protein